MSSETENEETIPFIDEKVPAYIRSNCLRKTGPETSYEMDENGPSKELQDNIEQPYTSVSVNELDATVLKFLENGPPIEETPDKNNGFPLHRAAERGNVKKLLKLLANGEDPTLQDVRKRTPLHYACGFAYQKKVLQMVDAILDCPQAQNLSYEDSRKMDLINSQDELGDTALHVAANVGHRQVVEKLLFSAADVNLKNKAGTEPLEVIYSRVPAAMIPVFDSAVECKVGDKNDLNLLVRLDFGAIVGYPEPHKDTSYFEIETKLLSYCLKLSESKRSAILCHPLVQVFLHLKWQKIRILLWISILYHMIWLLLYTLFLTDLYLVQCPYTKDHEYTESEIASGANVNNTGNSRSMDKDTDANSTVHLCDIGNHLVSSLNIKLGFLLYVTISVAIKELYELYSSPQLKLYFYQLENVGQWLLIGVVGFTSIPVFMMDNEGRTRIHAWQYQAAAFGILLAWTLILSQIGKIPRFGIYIEILAKVLRSFSMFMITFASLIVAFTVSFQILMPDKVEFQSLPWAFMKVIVMMTGEVNYDDVFYGEDAETQIPFPTSTKLLYFAFVAVVTIILFNLLIGLTVSDTQGLQSTAQLTSLSSQLDQIYLMEKFVISKKVQRRFKTLKKHNWIRYFLVTQQTEDHTTNMGVDIPIAKIPISLQHQIREIAVPNVIQDNDEDTDDEDDNGKDQEQGSQINSRSMLVPERETKIGVRATGGSTLNLDINDLKEQIREVLREVLEEVRLKESSTSDHE